MLSRWLGHWGMIKQMICFKDSWLIMGTEGESWNKKSQWDLFFVFCHRNKGTPWKRHCIGMELSFVSYAKCLQRVKVPNCAKKVWNKSFLKIYGYCISRSLGSRNPGYNFVFMCLGSEWGSHWLLLTYAHWPDQRCYDKGKTIYRVAHHTIVCGAHSLHQKYNTEQEKAFASWKV